MATQKLYDTMPYTTSFTAKIIGISEDLKGDISPFFYVIILDRTLFFPESGGQSCDRGFLHIDGFKYEVHHVSINEDDEISHHITAEVPFIKSLIGREVTGEIHWNHRFSNMQQHTGEHIISGLVNRFYHFQNVGFHLSDNIVTADFNGFLNEKAIGEIESKANEVIYQNVTVTCYYPREGELCDLPYRSKNDLSSNVRLVEIEGIDLCACCCPHVRTTGEIGIIKILSSIRYKGGSRITFICGKRALDYFSLLLKQSIEISQFLSVERESLLPAIQGLSNEKDRLKGQMGELRAKLLNLEVKESMFLNQHPLIFVENYSMAEIRNSVNKIIEESNFYCGIFSGNDHDGYTFVLGSKDLDCTLVVKKLIQCFDAKGGGKKEMIQGFVKGEKTAILKAITSLYI